MRGSQTLASSSKRGIKNNKGLLLIPAGTANSMQLIFVGKAACPHGGNQTQKLDRGSIQANSRSLQIAKGKARPDRNISPRGNGFESSISVCSNQRKIPNGCSILNDN